MISDIAAHLSKYRICQHEPRLHAFLSALIRYDLTDHPSLYTQTLAHLERRHLLPYAVHRALQLALRHLPDAFGGLRVFVLEDVRCAEGEEERMVGRRRGGDDADAGWSAGERGELDEVLADGARPAPDQQIQRLLCVGSFFSLGDGDGLGGLIESRSRYILHLIQALAGGEARYTDLSRLFECPVIWDVYEKPGLSDDVLCERARVANGCRPNQDTLDRVGYREHNAMWHTYLHERNSPPSRPRTSQRPLEYQPRFPRRCQQSRIRRAS